jgi:Rab-GTPase-TBC domain
MEEILYIWAKEYPEYKYQQGMNEILAVLVICLFSEILTEESDQKTNNGEEHLSDEGEDHEYDEAHKIYKTLHDPS